MADWKDLMRLTQGAHVRVERVRLPDSGVAIEGDFDLPTLAQLPAEDQVFIAAFVKSHGSIKEMERLFGVSYPTIKNRLHRLSERLEQELAVEAAGEARSQTAEVLDRLERGEITAQEALTALKS